MPNIIKAPTNDQDLTPPGTGSGSGPNIPGGSIPPGTVFKAQNQFDPKSILINYNEKFKNHPPAMYRYTETMQILAVLIGNAKPNPLLIGPAGCGKTKVVEDIARLLANNDPSIPDMLENFTIYELPISALVKGTGLVGSLDEKLEAVVKFLEDPNNRAICFIDEIHLLQSDNYSYSQVGQVLKPALARGALHLIGSTTLQEANSLSKDPAFNRRFTRIMINELSRKQTISIVRGYCSHLAGHYGHFQLEKGLIDYITDISEMRLCGHRPDNALTLIDRVIASMVVTKSLDTMITRRDVDDTISKMQGLANNGFRSSIPVLRDRLKCIKGQNANLDLICNKVRIQYLGGFPSDKPLSFLLAGNSGTGKTETAKVIAKQLFDTKPITINMTEYRSEASINRLVGAPAGYVGYDSSREMPFDIIQSNPYQLILLDEFEKSHSSVQELFMRILDEGRITNSYGQEIDFSKSIIIATTNAGYCTSASRSGLVKAAGTDSVSLLSDYLNPAILNRFTEIMSYDDITKDVYKDILREMYVQESTVYNRFAPCQIATALDDASLDQIADQTYKPEFGGRPAKKAIRDYILNNAQNQPAPAQTGVQGFVMNVQTA